MTTDSTPAGFWRRVGAKLFDCLFIFALQILAMILVAGLDIFVALGVGAVLGIVGIAVLVQVFYFAYGNSNGRRTFGYRKAGLRLENLSGQPLSLARSWWRALLSNVAGAVISYFMVLDFVPMLFSPRRRCGHDYICGSQVVSIAKPRLLALWSAPSLLLAFFGVWLSHTIWLVPLRAYYVPSSSMAPTVSLNDRLLSNLLAYRFRAPRDGEIAVFEAPAAALLSSENPSAKIDFIKRVVGTPGDVVTIVNRQLYRNGAPVREPYVDWDDHEPGNPFGATRNSYDMKIVGGAVYSRDYYGVNSPGAWTRNSIEVDEKKQRFISAAKAERVPPKQFLMLGDHRSNSNDSHVFGFVPRGAFEARAMITFWPIRKNLR